MKKKIYYVMDTMCGWCYGFSDVINAIYEKYQDVYDFKVLPGGMWTGDDVKVMNPSLGAYIKGHNANIEAITNKKFGDGYSKHILENPAARLDSLPGAKAVVLMDKLNKQATFQFLKQIQEAFFVHGKDANQVGTYSEIGEKFQIPKAVFEQEFASESLTVETFKAFSRVASLGAVSFPTVIVVDGDQNRIIAEGHSTFTELDEILSS